MPADLDERSRPRDLLKPIGELSARQGLRARPVHAALGDIHDLGLVDALSGREVAELRHAILVRITRLAGAVRIAHGCRGRTIAVLETLDADLLCEIADSGGARIYVR